MDEGVIDLSDYLDADGRGRGHFGVWGGDGVRARFALPTWRALNLVNAGRGGLVYLEGRDRSGPSAQGPTLVPEAPPTEPTGPPATSRQGPAPNPYFVLDLSSDRPRTDFSTAWFPESPGAPPVLHETEQTIVIHLCASDRLEWYLVLDGLPQTSPLDQAQREQLLFFAGECAGLLLHHGLAAEHERDGPPAEGAERSERGAIPDSGPSGA